MTLSIFIFILAEIYIPRKYQVVKKNQLFRLRKQKALWHIPIFHFTQLSASHLQGRKVMHVHYCQINAQCPSQWVLDTTSCEDRKVQASCGTQISRHTRYDRLFPGNLQTVDQQHVNPQFLVWGGSKIPSCIKICRLEWLWGK